MMDLMHTARLSIAFNPAVAEELNRKAAVLDPRLYCFAYYEPTPIPAEASFHAVFHLAVLNMYGLLWDCGPKILESVMSKNLYKKINRNADDLEKCYEFSRVINATRTDLCHNNSEKLYFNALLKKKKESYMTANGGAQDNANGAQIDWEKLCVDFFKRCDLLIHEIDGFIQTAISKNAPAPKQTWLDIIQRYYLNNEYFLLHVLADRYKLKQQMLGESKPITKDSVKCWVNDVAIDDPNYYDTYLQKCKTRIPKKMEAADCPKPVWPLDFFRLLTMDASNF